MSKIYGQANRVIVYLGEKADNSDQALEDIRTAAEYDPVYSSEADEQETNSSDQSLEKLRTAAEYDSGFLSPSEEGQKAISKLLERPWFRRVWVSQQTINGIQKSY